MGSFGLNGTDPYGPMNYYSVAKARDNTKLCGEPDTRHGEDLVELIDIVPVSVEITGVEIELAAGVTNSV